MDRLVENAINLLVRIAATYGACFVAYFILRPGGAGGMLWFFILMVVVVVPISLWFIDITRKFTKQAIAARFAVAIVTGVTYLLLVSMMSYTVSPINLAFAGPLVTAVFSELILRDRCKKS